MSPFKPVCSLWVSLVLLCAVTLPASGRRPSVFPDSVGQKVRYNATIELQRGYLSGVCVLLNEGDVVRGSLFNEFGLSALSFTYRPARQKVTIDHLVAMLNKWYIRRVLRRDLSRLMAHLRQGIGTYRNEKHHIDYNFSILSDATEE